MKKPAISVIIPVLGQEGFLQDTVNSVLNQTFQDFEIIVISSFEQEIPCCQNEKIRVHIKKNATNGAVYNYGLHHAKGDYVTFLEPGDLLKPEKFQLQAKFLDKKPEVGLVYCGANLIDKEGNFVSNLPAFSCRGNVFRKLVRHNYLHTLSVVMLRKECLEKAGRFDEAIKSNADWEFCMRLSLKYRFGRVRENLVQCRDKEEAAGFETFEDSGFRALNKIFQANSLRPKDLRLINYAYAMRYRHVGKRYYEKECFEKSRGFLFEAMKRDFLVMFRSDALVLYLLSCFAEKNRNFLEKICLKHQLYR